MQPKLIEDSPWQTRRNYHNKGTVYSQFIHTFRPRQLGMRSLGQFRGILQTITVFMPPPKTPAPGQIDPALNKDLNAVSLRCSLHRPIINIESVD